MNRAAWSARSAVRLVAWLLIETAAMRCVQPGSTVLRDREALVRLVTLVLDGDDVPEYGAAVTKGGAPVGTLTSPCESPTLGKVLLDFGA